MKVSSDRKNSSSSSPITSSSSSPKLASSPKDSSSTNSSKADSPKNKTKFHKHLRTKKSSKQHSNAEQQELIKHDLMVNNHNNELVLRQIEHHSSQYNNPKLQIIIEKVTNGDTTHFIGCENSMKEAFDFFDIDRDGRITSNELQQVLKFLDTPATPEEAIIMISDADSDGNGTVEFNEFLKLMNRYNERHNRSRSDDDEMREAFKVFDHNGDSYIDFEEIKKTMILLGERVTDEDVNAMINEADTDHDGKINFEEFKQMMTLMRRKVALGEQLAI